MNHKVLLADDSLTIQKVIKITLANQPYDITEASSEEELFKHLPALKPKLVFLDFNLSEKYSGYELSSKIKSICPDAKILLLLGTFDTVDDASMEKCGASDKIVKPFDSNKFIAICKQLIDAFGTEEMPYPQTKQEPKQDFHSTSEEDQWTVSHTTEQKFDSPQNLNEKALPHVENPLMKEVSDWGMSIPGVINDTASHDKTIDIPPIIDAVPTVKSTSEPRASLPKEFEQKFPQNDDLDYPTIEEMTPSSSAPIETAKPVSKLISIDSFKETPREFELGPMFHTNESDVKSLEAQIQDEVADNLWQADEFEDLKKEVSAKIGEMKNNFQPTLNDFDESLFKPLDDSESISWEDVASPQKPEPTFENSLGFQASSTVNLADVRQEMEEMVKKYVKEYLDQMFLKNAEKIAWEVIPDLAENLIRQELSKISNKILNDQG